MKKLIFLLLIVMATMVASAQTSWFKATHFSITPYPEVSWFEWYTTDIMVYMDVKAQHIEIYSEVTQILDFKEVEEIKFSNCKAYGAYGTDRNYKTIYIFIYFFYTGEVQLEIQYSDVAYKYQLKLYE
jgi:hypothetical protein